MYDLSSRGVRFGATLVGAACQYGLLRLNPKTNHSRNFTTKTGKSVQTDGTYS
jgi:hypothetical protein